MNSSKREKELNRIKKADKESIIDRFVKLVSLLYNGASTLLSLAFLLIMMALGLKNFWITMSLIILTCLNMLVTLLMVFVFYRRESQRTAKLFKEGIKILRLVVTVTNMILTISMWFTAYAASVFMTVLVRVFTIFYSITVVIQVAFWVKKITKIWRKKRLNRTAIK